MQRSRLKEAGENTINLEISVTTYLCGVFTIIFIFLSMLSEVLCVFKENFISMRIMGILKRFDLDLWSGAMSAGGWDKISMELQTVRA